MAFFSRILRTLQKRLRAYEPLITIRIRASHLLHNLYTYQHTHPEMLIAPVLKSNAYGHGLIEVAQILDGEKIAFFALDSLHEAHLLRSAGIRSPLLIIGYTPVTNMKRVSLRDIAFTVTSLSQLAELSTAGIRARIHIKLDTGMHRQGLLESEWSRAQMLLKQNSGLRLEGVCSHFADADNEDASFTQMQCAAWERGVASWKAYDPTIRFFHIAATAGSRFGVVGGANVLRLGLGLYGIDAAPEKKHVLKPVLQFETVLNSVKELQPGEAVGYNATFRATVPMRIATIPAGYFEGIDRRLSNKGTVLVRNIPCPIIGRVSMNITTIDVSNVPDPQRNERVIVLSSTPDAPNSVVSVAQTAGTIPWEILVHIPQHLRRVVDQ